MARIRFFVCLLLALLLGCNPTSKVSDTTDETDKAKEIRVNGPLRIVMVGDPDLAKVLQREWSATSDYEIEIRNESEESIYATLQSDSPRIEADAVVGPSSLLGQLAGKKMLRSLPPEITQRDGESAYMATDIFSGLTRKALQWDKRQFGVSFGSPTLLLMTRSDMVPSPPATWEELHEIAEQLNSENSLPDGVSSFSQPLADGWAAKTFLARSAPYMYEVGLISTYFNYATMAPRIANPPFVRALEEMTRDFNESDTQLSPNDVFAQFMNGESAIAVCWPTNKLNVSGNAEALAFQTVVSELPGVTEFYKTSEKKWLPLEDLNQIRRATTLGLAGKIGAITRSAKNAQLAGIFLGWATSPEQGAQLCPRGIDSAPFRNSHSVAANNWCDPRLNGAIALNYFETLKSATNRTECFVAPRIPGEEKYMRVLDEAILEALRGQTQPEEALKNVSEEWQKLTTELGEKNQNDAYRYSMGISVD